MLKKIKNVHVFNSIIILITVILAFMSINWHYKTFSMHKIEEKINAEIDYHKTVNRDLLADYANILSGEKIIYNSKKLMMIEPKQKQAIFL